jgi:predicted Zn-dependent peptidase
MHSKQFVFATCFSLSILTAAVLIQSVPASAAADSPTPVAQPAPAASSQVKLPIKEFTLQNGLRVYLSEDHSAPTYSICVIYDVGSRNERAGRTGFAHLFEHMMFQGSENVGKGEHLILVHTNGGGVNGTTNKDRTAYYETLPANQLDLGMFLEADRMRSLAVNQANLDNQRNAVQEERRLGLDNQPYGKTFEAIDDLAYDNPAYKHSVIGSMDDLNAASVDDVSAFFKTYYAPNNAVVALVGDFNSDEALAKLKKYFEQIPRQPAPPQPDMTEPPQKAERRLTLEDSFARLALINIVFRIPPGNTPDWYALDMLGDILAGGESSRMYQDLVEDKQIAVAVSAGPEDTRGPSLFNLEATVAPGKDPAEIEKALEAEAEKIKTSGVTQDEVEKVFIQDRLNLIRQDQGTLGRAYAIANDAVCFSDPNLINELVDKYRRVTPADIQRVAKQYILETNRSVITTVPKPGAAAGASR